MTTETTQGICLLCENRVDYHSIAIHIKKCIKKNCANNPAEKEKIFLFKIWQRDANDNLLWLYMEINGSATLEMLDIFLRESWPNCGVSIRSFNIDGETYDCNRNSNKKIFRLFKEETKFDYINNHESTNTELKGKVISTRHGRLAEDIRIIARNIFPLLTCY